MKKFLWFTLGLFCLLLVGVFMSEGRGGGYPQIQRVRSDFNTISSNLDTYEMLGKRGYPTEEQGLIALVERPSSGPIPQEWTNTLPEVPRDPWGNLYLYRFPGSWKPSESEVIPLGPDGVPSEDDLSSDD